MNLSLDLKTSSTHQFWPSGTLNYMKRNANHFGLMARHNAQAVSQPLLRSFKNVLCHSKVEDGVSSFHARGRLSRHCRDGSSVIHPSVARAQFVRGKPDTVVYTAQEYRHLGPSFSKLSSRARWSTSVGDHCRREMNEAHEMCAAGI